MPQTTTVISRFIQTLSRNQLAHHSDAELLRLFLNEQNEAAFAMLVDRHGAMVLGTAQRVLGDVYLAEDVFQATFWILAQKAQRLRHLDALPAWLHRTAYHLAITALRSVQRRKRLESTPQIKASINPLDDLSAQELLRIVDEEINRLPESARLPLILCCLQGKSLEEVADQLGWSKGAIKGRLERGRKTLKQRLLRRGLTFSVASTLPSFLFPNPVVAELLKATTIRQVLTKELPSPAVTLLIQQSTPTAFATLSKKLLFAICVLGFVGGVTFLLPQEQRSKVDDSSQPNKALVSNLDALPEGAIARLGSSRLRIGNSAYAFSADEKEIVAISPEGILRRFDAKTGDLLSRKMIADRTCVDMLHQPKAAISRDGKFAALLERNQGETEVSVWDLEANKRIYTCPKKHSSPSITFALSANGRYLAINEHHVGLQIFDVKTHKRKNVGQLEYNVYDMLFSEDANRILVRQVSANNIKDRYTVVLFDVAEEKPLWKLPIQAGEIAISPDGKIAVLSDYKEHGYQVIETDLQTGKHVDIFSHHNAAHPNKKLLIAPDNRTLWIDDFDSLIGWDLVSGEEKVCWPRKRDLGGYGPILGSFSADGNSLLTNYGYLQRWDLTTGKSLFHPPTEEGPHSIIHNVAFQPTGKNLLAITWSRELIEWDLATKKQVRFQKNLPARPIIPTHAGLRTLELHFHEKQNQVTIHDLSGAVDPKTVQLRNEAVPREKRSGTNAYSLTVDGQYLLFAMKYNDPINRTDSVFGYGIDVDTNQRRFEFDIPTGSRTTPSSFSPCGRWLHIYGTIYQTANGKEVFVLRGDNQEPMTRSVSFSRDSRYVAGRLEHVVDRKVRASKLCIWEMATGKLCCQIPDVESLSDFIWSDDNRLIAWLDGRGVHVHEIAKGQLLADFLTSDVTCDGLDEGFGSQSLTFSPDGKTLATGHTDGSILLWKIPEPKYKPQAVTPSDLDQLWNDLQHESPTKASTAMHRLIYHPHLSMQLLNQRFEAKATANEKEIRSLIVNLNSNTFHVREKASQRLIEFGPEAVPILQQTWKTADSPEMKDRIEKILQNKSMLLSHSIAQGETLRAIRAIEVLERIGTLEAKTLLQKWAAEGGPRPIYEAQAALARLTKNKK